MVSFSNGAAVQKSYKTNSTRGGTVYFLSLRAYFFQSGCFFFQRALILAALRDEPATHDTIGEGRSQEHHLCSLNAGVTGYDLV